MSDNKSKDAVLYSLKELKEMPAGTAAAAERERGKKANVKPVKKKSSFASDESADSLLAAQQDLLDSGVPVSTDTLGEIRDTTALAAGLTGALGGFGDGAHLDFEQGFDAADGRGEVDELRIDARHRRHAHHHTVGAEHGAAARAGGDGGGDLNHLLPAHLAHGGDEAVRERVFEPARVAQRVDPGAFVGDGGLVRRDELGLGDRCDAAPRNDLLDPGRGLVLGGVGGGGQARGICFTTCRGKPTSFGVWPR